jgi:carboxypeptidase D
MVTAWLAAYSLLLPSSAEKTASDYYVRSLPGQPAGPLLKMHAGHIEVDHEHNGNLFFWLYENRHIANKQRLVIWLNGGPGCSSMDGALMELGPYRVNADGTLRYNEGSWDEFVNLLFVDNPVGTGFSYTSTEGYVSELQQMADEFIIFMEKWYTLFPQFEGEDLYFAGESYAGQHIPYIAKAVMDRNSKLTGSQRRWNLKGLLIGNGWIAPVEQYLSYMPFAYAEGLITGGTDSASKVERAQSDCLTELGKPESLDKIDINRCENVLNVILSETKKNNKCFNMYDVRLKDDYPACGMNWPPDLTAVTPYLRRPDVIEAIHINPDKRAGWSECSGTVSSRFRARVSKPSVQLVPEILEAGVPIVLFSGAKDLICNHLGTEDFINRMQWSGGTGFEISPGTWAPKRDWTFEGEPAGIYQEARNLTYVLFYNSSHMVPFDYPRRTRDMLDRFIGVDIASIGGTPTDSRIDGEKAGVETSVGGHPNSTVAEVAEKDKLRAAELKAYYRSGETVLVVVVIAASLWGWFIYRSRRRAKIEGYAAVPLASGAAFRDKSRPGQDVEAGDFDENELDDLAIPNGRAAGRHLDTDHYDIGSDSEEDTMDRNKG